VLDSRLTERVGRPSVPNFDAPYMPSSLRTPWNKACPTPVHRLVVLPFRASWRRDGATPSPGTAKETSGSCTIQRDEAHPAHG